MRAVEQDEDARYRELRARRLKPLPGRALAWCALAPYWPEEVVEQLASRDTTVPFSIGALDDAVAGRVLEQLPYASPWDRPIYRIAAALREPAIEELTEPAEGTSGLDELRRELVAAGTAMRSAEKVAYDPLLSRWALLAEQAWSNASLETFLNARVTEALAEARETGRLAAPEALRWIEAVEPLAQLFQGTLFSALTLARGKRELAYRRADDERRLRNYYPPPAAARRPPRELAFHELLADPEHWALHYVGSGGGGKTMLLRYIANRLAPAASAAVARVDFDFLNPNYPLREPGMLLASFAEELRLHTGTDQAAFSAFDSQLADLNAWIARERADGRDGIVTIEHEQFKRVIDAFARACRRLDRTIVLMLDTCEELAKLRGSRLPENVKVTFDVLIALRERERIGERLRVIFSGRRVLAVSGHQWTAPGSLLPDRPFLRLFRISGFTEAEADDCLSTYRSAGNQVRADLHADILRLSLIDNDDADDEDTSRFLPPEPDTGPRYNPYDLDMYAEWAATANEKEPLTRERLEQAGPHFYVEERIAKRLAPEMWRLLPALVVLGRFDRDLLTQLVAGSAHGVALVEEIVEQEWVRPDRSAAGNKWFVDEGLRKRLLRYFHDARASELDQGRRLLAAMLPDLTLQRRFSELTERYFAATFDALRDQPEKAAEWWMRVEDKILESGEWSNWAQPLVRALLAEPEMSQQRPASFRPAVLALQAAAFLHADDQKSAPTWQEVASCLDAYPARTGRDRLHYRVDCALKSLWGSPDLLAVPDRDDPQCWGALAAALEPAVEHVDLASRTEPAGSPGVDEASPDPGLLAAASDPYIRAFGLMLQGRMSSVAARPLPGGILRARLLKNAERAFVDAARLATATPPACLDWIGPDDLDARIRLEYISALGRDLPSESPEPPSTRDTIDADRLRAARLLLADADVPQRNVSLARSALARPRCRAHSDTPPYDVVASEILGRTRPAVGIERLKEISNQTTAFGRPDVALHADRAIARTIRRHRLLSEGWALPASVVASQEPEDVRLRVITRALHISADAAAAGVADLPNPDPGPGNGASRRASAESLLEWAELAQLQRQGSVTRRLAEAVARFEAVDDTSGALRARIAQASRLARQGRLDRVQRFLAERALPLPGALSEATGLGPGDGPIPSRSDVEPPLVSVDEALAGASIPELLDRVDQGWRPWAVRAIAATLYAAGDSGKAQRTALIEWVSARYTTEIDGATHLPAEIALDPDDVPVWRKFTRDWVQVSGYVVASIVTAALAAALFYSSWWITTAAVPEWPALLRGVIAVLLPFLAVSLTTWGGPIVLRQSYGAVVLPTTATNVSVTMSHRPSDLNRPLTIPWSFATQRQVPFIRSTTDGPVTRPSTDERYRTLRESVGLTWVPRNDQLLRLLNTVMHVKVAIEPYAAAAPWEAIFGLSSPQTRDLASSRLHVYRTLQAYRRAEQSDWNSPMAVTTWAPGVQLARGSSQWGTFQASGGRLGFETVPSAREYEQAQPNPYTGVLHVIGTPVERHGDVYLQSGGLQKAGDEPYLLAVDQLPRRYPALRLLVVQATPSASADRTAADRLEAAFLKRLGAAAFQAGVPAVLVVPGIPPEVTAQMTALLFDVLRGNSRNATPQLIAAHRRIQEHVGAAWPSALEESLEIALDTCLYVADRVNLRVDLGANWLPNTTTTSTKGDRS